MDDLGPDPDAPASARRRKWRLNVSTGQRRTNPDGTPGSYVRKTTRFTGTKTEAIAELRRLHHAVDQGTVMAAKAVTGLTYGQLLTQWRSHAEHNEHLSPNTLRTYDWYITAHIRPALGQRAVHQLGVAELDGFYRKLTEAGLAPKTVRQAHAIIRRSLRQGCAWGYLERNVAELTAKPSVTPSKIRPPSIPQVQALLAAARADGPDTMVLLQLAVATGARRAELCGLRWDEINLDTGQVEIRRSTAQVDGATVLLPTKTDRERLVTVDAGTIAVLTAWKTEQAAKFAPITIPWVFAKLNGGPWSPDLAALRWERIRKVAAKTDPTIANVRLHDLRHWQASVLLAAGVAPTTVSERLGHASTKVTLDVYGHGSRQADADASRIIEQLYSAPPGPEEPEEPSVLPEG